MNPYHHALSSAEKYGGEPEDYLEIHRWFDESKAFLPDFRHRALRHHAEGIFLAERIFGLTLTNSAGRMIPTRFIGEQHVKEDLGRIPTAQDWLECIAPQAWMMRTGKSDKDQAETEIVEASADTRPRFVVSIKGGMIDDVFATDQSMRITVVDRDVADDEGCVQTSDYSDIRPMSALNGTELARSLAQSDAGKASPGEMVADKDESRQFRNHYRCPRCGKTWVDEWSATCDDDCPHCGARHISPLRSEGIASEAYKPRRHTLSVGELIAQLHRLAEQSPLGEETSVCVSRPETDYEDLLPPILERDPDGAVMLLTPVCDGCGDTPGVRLDADPSCSFEFELPTGFVIIERCDTCDRFVDDLDAAKSLADHAHWIHCAAGHRHAIGLPRTKEDRHESTQAASL